MNVSSIFKINKIDHYAVVVKDIETSKQFHMDFLGFAFVNSYKLQTSDKNEGDDTFSIVLSKTNTFGKEVCVLNQPLNEFSFLNPYIQKYGEGIHHIAYAVDNIEEEFEKGLKSNICFTSDKIIIDHNNNLKQIFIERKYTGYFIELVDRGDGSTEQDNNLFSHNNVKDLIISTSKNL